MMESKQSLTPSSSSEEIRNFTFITVSLVLTYCGLFSLFQLFVSLRMIAMY